MDEHGRQGDNNFERRWVRKLTEAGASAFMTRFLYKEFCRTSRLDKVLSVASIYVIVFSEPRSHFHQEQRLELSKQPKRVGSRSQHWGKKVISTGFCFGCYLDIRIGLRSQPVWGYILVTPISDLANVPL